jgi:HAE1 family hydrophobic/amphiphilic exporter-1
VRRWSLSDLALARPVMIGMTLVALLLLGIIAAYQLPLTFLPSYAGQRIYVRVRITRTSPEILEREVIRPIEEQIAGIRDLQRIQIGSGSWGVRANLEFKPGTDLDARKIELRDRLERARAVLPEIVQRLEIGTYTNTDDPIMEVRISAETDLTDNYYLIEQRVVRPIERIKGIARVDIGGVEPHELEVAVDLDAVGRTGVSLQELGATVRNAGRGRSLGLLRQARKNPGVRSPAERAEPDRFAALPLQRGVAAAPAEDSAAEDTSFARLGEVADVTVHPEKGRRGNRLNAQPAINLSVYAAAGASIVDVTREVRAAINDMASEPALGGLHVKVFHDQGEIILETLGDLRNTGIYGGSLAILVLFAFLRRWRTTLTAALSIPLSVLAACAVLFLRGEELNCIVLLGLVLGVGMLIDNAVVIVEAIQVQRRRGYEPLLAARRGAREVGLATIASTLSSVIVFLPLVMSSGVDEMTAYLRPLGTTFAIALIASLFVSQMAVPLLLGRLLKPDPRPVHHRILDRVAAAYAWLIKRTLRFRRLTTLTGLALAATALYPASGVNLKLGDIDFRPDALPIRLQMVGSHGKERVIEHITVMEEALLGNKEALGIESLACSYRDWGGRCSVYPTRRVESEAEMEAFEERIRQALPDQPGLKYRLGERDHHWRENRDRKVVEFAVKGEDMGILMELGEQVAQHLKSKLGKGDPAQPEAGGYDLITSPFTEGAREVHVLLDDTRLQPLGLGSNQVAQLVSMAFQGVPLGQVRGEDGEIRLRLSTGSVDDDEDGPGIEQLRDLRIRGATGQEVSLGSIATLQIVRQPWWIQRVDRQTEVRMSVRFFDTNAEANWQTVEEAMSTFRFPSGYSWGKGTRWRGRQDSSNEMVVNLALCMLLVYAVMASLFESFLQPFAILVTCVLGCFGAPWAMWLTNTTVDTTALIGVFILIGIVVNNGIMLIDKVTQLRAAGMPREEALQQAGRERIRPIIMTAITTILGLLPMLIHHPTLAGVYYHAVAIVVAGGLMTSTVITLVFLPAAYSLLEDLALSARARWRIVIR